MAALIKAIREGDEAAVAKFVAARVDVNALGAGLKDRLVEPATPLMEAADWDRPRIAEMLIDAGADVNWSAPMGERGWQNYGQTALMVAAWRGHAAVAEVLLMKGADLEARASDPKLIGGRAIHYAVRGGDAACVRMLVKAGAEVNAKSGDQRTALQLVKGKKSKEMLAALRGEEGGTIANERADSQALLEAAEAGNVSLVMMILSAGTNVNAVDAAGDSVLTNAALHGQREVVKLLLKMGADPKRVRKGEASALMHAAQNDWPDVVKVMIEAGADVNHVSRLEHETALDLAEAYDAQGCVRILKKAGAKTADEVAPRKVKIPHPMAEDEVPMAKAPHLSKGLDLNAFIAAARQVEKWAGVRGRESGIGGVVEFEMPQKTAAKVIAEKQAELLKKGFYLVVSTERVTEGRPWTMWLVASDRWEDVIALARTNGSNYDIGSKKIIAELKAIEKTNRFVLTGAGADRVSGKFLGKVKDAEALAKRIAKLAPDVVNEGTETVKRLEELLKEDGRFQLWWH